MPIPRRLHHIWLGPLPVPERWAAAWRRRHPGWEYRLWGEADIEPILPDGLRAPWRSFVERGRWHGAADIARVAILLREGGVYVDIDSEPVRSLDRAPFMRASFFAGLQYGTSERIEWVNNGVIGAEAGHPILTRYAALIEAAEIIDPPWQTVGGAYFTIAVRALRHLPGVAILPARTFYPEDKGGERVGGRGRVYIRQYWATTGKLYAFEGESWQDLARRRRGEPPLPPLGTRIREGAAQRSQQLRAQLRKLRPRRLFRKLVPLSARSRARSLLARLRGRGDHMALAWMALGAPALLRPEDGIEALGACLLLAPGGLRGLALEVQSRDLIRVAFPDDPALLE
jgi:Glycosyltransferase sugar-binding region containing DXD motif